MDEAWSLAGRTAVLVGAASAMGLASARELASAGAEVVLADLRVEPIEACAASLRADGQRAHARPCDVTRSADLEALADFAGTLHSPPFVWANLAGVIADAPIAELPEAELDRVLAVNLKGVVLGCQAASRILVPRGAGSIVNMASSGAFTPLPGLGAYAMSKAGVVALSRTLAAELGPHGVRVNTIAPGYVEGGMSARHARRPDGSVDEASMEPIRERTRRRTALGVLGQPADVAHALRFLACDASRTITGQVLHANGGAYMP